MFRCLISIPKSKSIEQISKYLPRSLVHGEPRGEHTPNNVPFVQLLSCTFDQSKIPLRPQVKIHLRKQNMCVTTRQNEAAKEKKRDICMQSKCEKLHC